jgi:hypothetical protein
MPQHRASRSSETAIAVLITTAMCRGLGGVDFAEYASLGGVRVPTHGEAWWQLPERRFV